MTTNKLQATYLQLSDGFEFVINIPKSKLMVTLPFMAMAIYDLEQERWIKYGTRFYDDKYFEYEWRSGAPEDRRQTFDDVAVLTYEELKVMGYLTRDERLNIFRGNLSELARRRRAFVQTLMDQPTTKNLGLDEDFKKEMLEFEARNELLKLGQELSIPIDDVDDAMREDEIADDVYIPPRPAGRTYIQLGDGIQLIFNRAYESLNHMMKMSSVQIYDMLEHRWIKYNSTIYLEGDVRCSKFFANEEDRPLDFSSVAVVNYDDLVREGYMVDAGEGNMARYRFDYFAFKQKLRAANIQRQDKDENNDDA